MPIADRRTRLLLAVSAVALGLAVLDLALLDGIAATFAGTGLGPRSALLAVGSVALPGLLLLGRLVGHAGPLSVRSVAVTLPAPADHPAGPGTRLLLRQQARHHTGTVLALRI